MNPMNLPGKYLGTGLPATIQAPALPGVAMPMVAEDRLDLRHLFALFRRRLPLFLAVLGGVTLLALVYTLTQPKRFRAMADVVMNTTPDETLTGGTAAKPESRRRSEDIDTELKIIRSSEMAKRVIDRLKLAANPEFVADMLGGNAPQSGTEALRSRLAEAMAANLKADRLETSYAIRITYDDIDAVRAARIANALAATYANSSAEGKRTENSKAAELLKGKIEELRVQAQRDFNAVQDFRVRNNLLSAEATALSEQEAAAYGQQLAAARAAAAGEQGKANAAGGMAAQAAVNSPVVQSLRAQRAVISVRIADLSGRYLDGHPDLVTAKRQLSDIDGQIAAEIGRVNAGVAAGTQSLARASAQQVGSLQGNLGAARARLAENNRALVGLDDLSRRSQASQSLYESYLNRYKEILAQSGTERADARLMTPAKIPTRPISPNIPLNLMLGMLIGGLLGTSAAFAAESSFSGLTTGKEVEDRVGLRFLGSIPLLSSIDIADMTPLDSIAAQPGSAYAESMRGLLAAVRQGRGDRHQVIAISSALPDEGKTSVAASLARVSALAGERVIVIDCDTIRTSLSRTFGAQPQSPGLREMLKGDIKLGDALIKDAHSEAMILPITTSFSEGERLLEKGHFHSLIAVLREHFSMIILDTAPILPIAETREILTLADHVILSALWRKTPDSAIRAAAKLLPLHAINDVGVALNRVDVKKQVRFGAGDATYYYNDYRQYYRES
jgi:polysaccharide biosynthesis transport protein